MVRSLYSGISGLRTHQVGLDVTANNIANVNTVAFKAGRATFKESMVQMLQGPSRPAGNQGGRNPMQLGLGVAVGSIDTMLRQGNFQTTGQITDLALEGRAYFAFSNGSSRYYSRNGGIQMDSSGHLVSPTNGWRLQGKMANIDGTYDPTAMIGDIRIPWGDKAPARATDVMALACNLNSDSQALGTVTHTQRFLASASALLDQSQDAHGNIINDFASRARLTDLFNENGESLRIKEGDTISFSVADTNAPTFNFKVDKYEVVVPMLDANGDVRLKLDANGDPIQKVENGVPVVDGNNDPVYEILTEVKMQIPTLQDFMNHLEAYLNGIQASNVTGPTAPPTMGERRTNLAEFMENYTGNGAIKVSIDPDTGGISIVNDSGSNITGLQVGSSRPDSKAFVGNAFLFPATIQHNTAGVAGTPTDPSDPDYLDPSDPNWVATIPSTLGDINHTTPGIRIPAVATDNLANLFDAAGASLGFSNGDTVNISGSVGGKNKTVSFVYYDGSDNINAPTKMEDLMLKMQEAYGLPSSDGTIYNRPSLTIKNSNDLTNDGIPIGAIVIRGQPELAFSLTALSVIGKQADPNQEKAPTKFSTNMTFTQTQAARNTGVWTASEIVYDDSGAEHNVSITFTHTGIPGEWLWEMTTLGGDEVILGGNRGRVTFMDGTPASFTFDDGSNQFRFDPRNGSTEVAIKLDVGEPGSTLGITQYQEPCTTAFKSQNGYSMGKLSEITVSESGEISGLYTNGVSKSIATIYVAEFNNPAGLLKMGDSMFGVSNNSGDAAMYQPGVGSTTTVKPGALEMSNVELETEFTNMITIQRGYQASARVVSTSDQMLQELVQLVR